MKKAFVSLGIVIAASCTLCACQDANSAALAKTKETAADVQKQAEGVVAAFNAQDAARTAAFDAPDYVGIYHGTANTNGPAEDEAGMKAQMAEGAAHWQLGPSHVTVDRNGDMAVFEAPYTFTIAGPDSEKLHETGNWIAIFMRQEDGSMKLWRSIASDTPPPAGQASAS